MYWWTKYDRVHRKRTPIQLKAAKKNTKSFCQSGIACVCASVFVCTRVLVRVRKEKNNSSAIMWSILSMIFYSIILSENYLGNLSKLLTIDGDGASTVTSSGWLMAMAAATDSIESRIHRRGEYQQHVAQMILNLTRANMIRIWRKYFIRFTAHTHTNINIFAPNSIEFDTGCNDDVFDMDIDVKSIHAHIHWMDAMRYTYIYMPDGNKFNFSIVLCAAVRHFLYHRVYCSFSPYAADWGCRLSFPVPCTYRVASTRVRRTDRRVNKQNSSKMDTPTCCIMCSSPLPSLPSFENSLQTVAIFGGCRRFFFGNLSDKCICAHTKRSIKYRYNNIVYIKIIESFRACVSPYFDAWIIKCSLTL